MFTVYADSLRVWGPVGGVGRITHVRSGDVLFPLLSPVLVTRISSVVSILTDSLYVTVSYT